jgi:pyruvate dehydrogenase E2 component (dihydrolipoamide acetyltransferase)
MRYKLTLPDIGEGVVEAEVLRWFVAVGDAVVEDQPLVEVMTDKATVTIPSPRRGRVERLCCQVGAQARVHAPLLELELDGAPAAPPAPADASALAGPGAGRRALATPAVRALARTMGLDLQQVPGTGRGGRVTKEDLQAHGAGDGVPGQGAPAGALAPAAPERAERRVALRGVRRRIAENMTRAARTAAYTFVEQADVTELVRVRRQMAEAGKAKGVRITYLTFIVKAVVAALRKFPELNASYDEARTELVLKGWYDIGIASATEQGLMVPVVRGADRLSLLELANEIARVAGDAKAGRSRVEDVGGSTFTVTSLGELGGLFATPVLNYPEVGILGVHRIRPTPVVRDDQIVARDVLHVSTTGDHRVVDGVALAAFTCEVVKYLEDPSLLFMEMV